MNGPLESLYFKWLCAKVIQVQHPTPSLTYKKLLNCLYTTEFVWLVTGDDNRAEDGEELRVEFMLECDVPDNQEWRALGCSVLEMLIAFSRIAEFDTLIPAKEWFWEFLDNLGLKDFNDADIELTEVEDILDVFIWRTYNEQGEGGLFPIQDTHNDQRTVEIWYQFCEYSRDRVG